MMHHRKAPPAPAKMELATQVHLSNRPVIDVVYTFVVGHCTNGEDAHAFKSCLICFFFVCKYCLQSRKNVDICTKT